MYPYRVEALFIQTTEAGKPKRIIEPAQFSHQGIMPEFSPRGEGQNPGDQEVSRPSQALVYPRGWEKNPILEQLMVWAPFWAKVCITSRRGR